MVTAFHKAIFQVKVEDVVVGGSEAKKNASKVIVIKFAIPIIATVDTNPWAKHFQMGQIRFHAKVMFEWSDFGFAMDQPIVKVDRMEEGCWPKFSRETRAVE